MRFDASWPGHVDKPTLLAWSEGELSWWRSRVVGRHVRSCWQCKAQARELEALICAAGLSVAGLPEPSRMDTAKAYWRFREACRQIDQAPQPRRIRVWSAWRIAAAAVLATAGLAYVTTHQRFGVLPPEKQASIPWDVRIPRPLEAPETAVAAAREAVIPPAPPRFPPLKEKRGLMLLSGPAEAELLAAEIHALAALHRSRFCMSSEIAVRRAGSAVEISGFVQSRDRRDRLRGVLEGIAPPDTVRIRLRDPLEEAGTDHRATELQQGPDTPMERIAPPIEVWLRDCMEVGSRVSEREMFNLMNAVVLESEKVSSEAWAVRHLAEQFPPARARRLSAELSDELLQMVDDHATALRNSLQALQERLQPVLGSQPAQSKALAPGPDEPWQSRVVALQRRVEEVVSRLLESFSAGGAAPVGDSKAMSDFPALLSFFDGGFGDCLASIADLRASVQTRSTDNRRVNSRIEDR
jgi:hypothetical protein